MDDEYRNLNDSDAGDTGENRENNNDDEILGGESFDAADQSYSSQEEPQNDSQPTGDPAPHEQGEPWYDHYNSYYGQNPQQPQYGQNQNPQYGAPYNGNYSQSGQSGYSYAPAYNNNPQKPPKKGNKGTKVFIAVVVAIVVVAVALMIAIFTGNLDDGESSVREETTTRNTTNVGELTAGDSSLEAGEAAQVAEVAQQYNVGILIYSDDTLYTEGSGVVVKEDNEGKYTYIVTCAHVINYDGIAVSVLMEDGTEYPAEVVGMDTRTDIGVVRIEASGLTLAELADSDDLVVGQTVYAVGNPGGSEFFGSITNGIISAIDRPISSETGYEMECIQHTAAINPGNSGGALVNGEGKVIGINSMKIASTEYEGMGFAVPSSVVTEVFNSIIDNGYVAGRPKLGITYTSPSSYSQTYAMYVQMRGLPSGTIVIASVSSDSALAGHDVREGDLITKVNGKDMTDTGMLADMIEEMAVGDTLTLTIVRINTDSWTQSEQNIEVTLVEDKGVIAGAETTTQSQQSGPSGYSYDDWYEYFKDQYGY